MKSVALSEAMKRVHARRIASGEDRAIRQRIRETRLKKGDWTQCDASKWADYRRAVRVVTSEQPIHLLQNHHLRGRGPGKYHLDHIVSQKMGFDLGIPAWFIGDISNLRFIPETQNCSKQHFSEMDDVLHLWYSLTETFE